MSEVRVTENPNTETSDWLAAESSSVGAQKQSFTPGSVLRRAREERGQSIADVVQVIRFSARQIEALERDDYASLPGSTAVRGLVRNYAKFLKLDATPLLAQLDPAVPVPAAEVRPPTNMGQAEQHTIVERVPLKLLLGGVIALLLALAAYWYSGLDAVSLTEILGGLDGRSRQASSKPPAAREQVQVVAPSPTVLAGSESPGAPVAAGAPPFAGLRVEFDERAWVEIRDASQKTVFSGEYPAGTRQNVDGKTPFQIWIGKASAVRLFMGERSIDLKHHTREDVARLSLE
jgi:cytoskeleton protein RodZ